MYQAGRSFIIKRTGFMENESGTSRRLDIQKPVSAGVGKVEKIGKKYLCTVTWWVKCVKRNI
jgi:hypothetical protein